MYPDGQSTRTHAEDTAIDPLPLEAESAPKFERPSPQTFTNLCRYHDGPEAKQGCSTRHAGGRFG